MHVSPHPIQNGLVLLSFIPVLHLIDPVVPLIPTTEAPITEEPANFSAPEVLGLGISNNDLFLLAHPPNNVQFLRQALSNYPNHKFQYLLDGFQHGFS